METNFKNVAEKLFESKGVKLMDFQKNNIRDIERELDRGTFDIDAALDKLHKIDDLPRLEFEDKKYIKDHIRK